MIDFTLLCDDDLELYLKYLICKFIDAIASVDDS